MHCWEEMLSLTWEGVEGGNRHKGMTQLFVDNCSQALHWLQLFRSSKRFVTFAHSDGIHPTGYLPPRISSREPTNWQCTAGCMPALL